MVSNVLLVVSVAALGVALLSGVHGLRRMAPWTYAALGVYALSFGGFLLAQGG